MRFFVGLHQPSDARRFASVFLSVNRLRGPKGRRRAFGPCDWIMDSGAFTELAKHGRYRDAPEAYAADVLRWRGVANMLAAVSQDFMCEPWILGRTGLTVADHQRQTIERFDAIAAALGRGHRAPYLMPVLQGYEPEEYAAHIAAYGDRLAGGAWVGVGSVCKRNGSPGKVLAVLEAIRGVRPDLKLHGFGLKLTSLADAAVRDRLATADSMAWSFSARRQGRSPNDWREARRFADAIDAGADGLRDFRTRWGPDEARAAQLQLFGSGSDVPVKRPPPKPKEEAGHGRP